MQKIHHNNISTRLYYSSRDVFNVKSVYVLGVSVLSEWWQFNKKKFRVLQLSKKMSLKSQFSIEITLHKRGREKNSKPLPIEGFICLELLYLDILLLDRA